VDKRQQEIDLITRWNEIKEAMDDVIRISQIQQKTMESVVKNKDLPPDVKTQIQKALREDIEAFLLQYNFSKDVFDSNLLQFSRQCKLQRRPGVKQKLKEKRKSLTLRRSRG